MSAGTRTKSSSKAVAVGFLMVSLAGQAPGAFAMQLDQVSLQ